MVQNKSIKSLFDSIKTLRSILGEKNNLQIIHPGAVWYASFAWKSPIAQEAINVIENTLGARLPKDYDLFLTSVSDGAILYYDIKYGQWGYKIYGTAEIVDQQQKWENSFGELWIDSFIAIGEIIDENHPIVVNTGIDSIDQLGKQLIEGNPLDPIVYWSIMSSSFHEWIDHLITSQGAKFWDWK